MSNDPTSNGAKPPVTMTALLDLVDWRRLSPEIQAIIRVLGQGIADGYSVKELAEQFGKSESWVNARVAELREAFLEQAGELEAELRERADELRRRPRRKTPPRATPEQEPGQPEPPKSSLSGLLSDAERGIPLIGPDPRGRW